MTDSFGTNDGRWRRALSAVRTILRMGLDENDIMKIMKWLRRVARRQTPPATGQDMDKWERLRLAQNAIRTLMRLGFSESQIADMIEVDHSTIAKALDPTDPRVMSPDRVAQLLQAVQNAGVERLKTLLPSFPLQLLDTCCDAGRVLDRATRTRVEEAARADLQNALLLGNVAVPSVSGIYAYLAQVGAADQGLFMIKVPPESSDPSEQLTHLEMLEHELGHLVSRVRARRKKAEKSRGRLVTPPTDGRIA